MIPEDISEEGAQKFREKIAEEILKLFGQKQTADADGNLELETKEIQVARRPMHVELDDVEEGSPA